MAAPHPSAASSAVDNAITACDSARPTRVALFIPDTQDLRAQCHSRPHNCRSTVLAHWAGTSTRRIWSDAPPNTALILVLLYNTASESLHPFRWEQIRRSLINLDARHVMVGDGPVNSTTQLRIRAVRPTTSVAALLDPLRVPCPRGVIAKPSTPTDKALNTLLSFDRTAIMLGILPSSISNALSWHIPDKAHSRKLAPIKDVSTLVDHLRSSLLTAALGLYTSRYDALCSLTQSSLHGSTLHQDLAAASGYTTSFSRATSASRRWASRRTKTRRGKDRQDPFARWQRGSNLRSLPATNYDENFCGWDFPSAFLLSRAMLKRRHSTQHYLPRFF